MRRFLLAVAVLLFLAATGAAAWHWQHVNYAFCVSLGLALMVAATLVDGIITPR